MVTLRLRSWRRMPVRHQRTATFETTASKVRTSSMPSVSGWFPRISRPSITGMRSWKVSGRNDFGEAVPSCDPTMRMAGPAPSMMRVALPEAGFTIALCLPARGISRVPVMRWTPGSRSRVPAFSARRFRNSPVRSGREARSGNCFEASGTSSARREGVERRRKSRTVRGGSFRGE